MGVFSENAIIGASAAGVSYDIDNSLRFNNGDQPRLTKNLSGGNKRIFTTSFWFKWSLVASRDFWNAWTGTNNAANWLNMGFSSSGEFRIEGWSVAYFKNNTTIS